MYQNGVFYEGSSEITDMVTKIRYNSCTTENEAYSEMSTG